MWGRLNTAINTIQDRLEDVIQEAATDGPPEDGTFAEPMEPEDEVAMGDVSSEEQGIPQPRLDAVSAKLNLSQRCQRELAKARGATAHLALVLLAELEDTADAQDVMRTEIVAQVRSLQKENAAQHEVIQKQRARDREGSSAATAAPEPAVDVEEMKRAYETRFTKLKQQAKARISSLEAKLE